MFVLEGLEKGWPGGDLCRSIFFPQKEMTFVPEGRRLCGLDLVGLLLLVPGSRPLPRLESGNKSNQFAGVKYPLSSNPDEDIMSIILLYLQHS